jgi:phospholipid/cholesterol/gamma-HCH transport system ATP-binding protein
VLFDGRVLADLNDRELTKQRLRFGFLFQSAALFDSLTVYDNVAFGLREIGALADSQIRERVRHGLQEVGLPPEVETKKPAELSGGMKKRVGLARALAIDPEVMLYDEPTTGLDPIMSDVINELIVQTRRRHPVTSIVVTHDMKTAQKVGDRVVMLYPLTRLEPSERQVLFDGSPAQLQRSPDPRVRQFVEGQAQDRLTEMAERVSGISSGRGTG